MHNEAQCLRNEIQTMRPQWMNAQRVALHHYANRHDGRTSKPARQWLAEFRRLYRPQAIERLAQIEAGAPMRQWNSTTGQWA
jgi:hypothetical protein